jgi:hypothetical protein
MPETKDMPPDFPSLKKEAAEPQRVREDVELTGACPEKRAQSCRNGLLWSRRHKKGRARCRIKPLLVCPFATNGQTDEPG